MRAENGRQDAPRPETCQHTPHHSAVSCGPLFLAYIHTNRHERKGALAGLKKGATKRSRRSGIPALSIERACLTCSSPCAYLVGCKWLIGSLARAGLGLRVIFSLRPIKRTPRGSKGIRQNKLASRVSRLREGGARHRRGWQSCIIREVRLLSTNHGQKNPAANGR